LLGGTGVPSSGRLSIGAKSPLTGGIKESNGGGTAAGKLARLGIKAIIVQGRPNNRAPYVVFVSRHRHELVACPELRLVGVYESAKRLQERFGSKVGIILIGPAGERFMTAAGVTNLDVDGVPSRYCARGGLGAVMGSQGLKAIVVDDSEHGDHHENCTTDFNIGLSENTASDLIGLAPVPATEILTVTMGAPGGSVVLIDPQGRAMMTQRLVVGANDMDVRHFARGMFIIEVRDARGGVLHRSPILLQ